MTDRMSDEQLDREIRAFLVWQERDVASAPSAAAMTARVGSRVGHVTVAPRRLLQVAWVVIAGLTIAALVGALVTGSGSAGPRPLVPNAYEAVPASLEPAAHESASIPAAATASGHEAVFVRSEIFDGSRVVTVVGVNKAGQERTIVRLPDAWISYPDFSPAPMGVVSPGGLLAIPSNRGEARMMVHWEVVDLRRPYVPPFVVPGILQLIDEVRPTPYFAVNGRGGAFWGPGERLAILWYFCSSSCTPDLKLSFYDAPAGATALVDNPAEVAPYWAADGSGVFEGGPPGDRQARIRRIDGSLVDAGRETGLPSCRSQSRAGSTIARDNDGRLVLHPADGGAADLIGADVGGYACFAPDDTAIVIQDGSNGSPFQARLLVPETGDAFDIDGSFAGWMEVTP